jgi:hypothetical protein
MQLAGHQWKSYANLSSKIAELQAQLKTHEEELETLQEHVLKIMTQESVTNPFPSTPTYVELDGRLVAKLLLLQDEMMAKEKTFRETILALEIHRNLQAQIPLETPGPHRLQAKTPRPEDLLYQQKIQQQETAENKLAKQTTASTNNSDPSQNLVDVFKQLTRVVKENSTY